MFESITIMPHKQVGIPAHVDVGFLAETLLFYQEVRLMVNPRMFADLVFRCGADEVMELIRSGALKVIILAKSFCVFSSFTPDGQQNIQSGLALMNDLKEPLDEFAFEVFKGATMKPRKAQHFARDFCSLTEVQEYDFDFFERMYQDFADRDYVQSAIGPMLTVRFPEYQQPSSIVFDIHRTEGHGLAVETNLNFGELTRLYRERTRDLNGGINSSSFLDWFMYARADIEYAARVSSELAVDELDSAIIKQKVNTILARRQQSREEISYFQQVSLKNARAIREAINTKERTFGEFVRLLEEARKFRHWLKDQPADEALIEAYIDEVTSSTPRLRDLQKKTVRYLLFTGGGTLLGVGAGFITASPVSAIIGSASGLLAGAVDTYLADRLFAGWKPHQFVNDSLKKFTLQQ